MDFLGTLMARVRRSGRQRVGKGSNARESGRAFQLALQLRFVLPDENGSAILAGDDFVGLSDLIDKLGFQYFKAYGARSVAAVDKAQHLAVFPALETIIIGSQQ